MKSAGSYLRRTGLALVLLLYLGLAVAFSHTIPLSKAPDEYVHFLYARFLADHGRPPLTLEEQSEAGYKSDQPPLYHALVALATSGIDVSPPPAFKFSWEPHSRQLIDIVLPRALLIRTEDETWPLAGVFLAWMAGRWLSIIIGGLTVLVTYFIAREMFPDQYWLAVGAAGTLAFVPRFMFTSSVLSDDNLVGLVMALFLYVVVKLFTDEPRPSSSTAYTLLGIITGLALSTKYTVLLVPFELLVLTLWLARRQQWQWRTAVSRLVLFGMTLILISSAWFSFLWTNFNEIEQQGLVMGLVRPIMAGGNNPGETGAILETVTGGGVASEFSEGNAWDWMRTLFTQFWDVPIFGVPQPYPLQVVLLFALLLCGLAVVGWWRRWQTGPKIQRSWLGLLLLHLMIFLPIPLIRFLAIGDIHDTAQARHLLFPAAPAMAILLVAGVSGLVTIRWQRWAIAGVVFSMLLLSLAHLYYYRIGFPPPLPVRTDPSLADAPDRLLSVTFDDGLHLRGFDRQLLADDSLLTLNLHWRADAVPADDYRTEITLRNRSGNVKLRWLSHPAAGRFPTRTWDVGDSVRDTLHIPLVGLPAADYQIALRLLNWQNQPLGAETDETVSLGQVSLKPPAVQTVMLWQSGRPVKKPAFRYRATIPVTVPDGRQAVLVGPNDQTVEPMTEGTLQLFMIDHTWPSGAYRLLMDGADAGLSLRVENFEWDFAPPEMSHVVNANFNNEIMLLDYDLPLRRVQAGDGVPLVLYWQSLRQMDANYIIFDRLVDSHGQVWGGYDRHPRETYPTNLWVPGEVVDDGFAVPVAAAAPDGIYNIVIGLYAEADPTAQSVPLLKDGRPSGQTSLTIGPVKVGGPPSGAVLAGEAVDPQHSLNLELGQPPVIRLRGYDLSQNENTIDVTFYWESLAVTDTDWSIFLHVRDAAGETVTQKDGPVGSGRYPTSLWDADELLADTLRLSLEEVEPGQYTLVTGLYRVTDGQRLAVPGQQNSELSLTEIEVTK